MANSRVRKPVTHGEWITAQEASNRLGIHPNALPKVCEVASIRRREIPGCYPKYSAEDVQVIVDDAIKTGPRTGRLRRRKVAVP